MDSPTEPRVSPETVAKSWQLLPAASVGPRLGAGLSLAIFDARTPADLELASPRDEHVHVLSVELSRVDIDLEVDGRLIFAGRTPMGGANIVRAGSRAVARVRGGFSVLQLYLPAAGLKSIAQDLGVPYAAAQSLTLQDPAFEIDRYLLALATSLDMRMGAGEDLSRLELDHLSLALSEHLVRTWSDVEVPVANAAVLSSDEQSAILEYLLDSDTPDYHGLSVLLDRAEIDACRSILATTHRPAHLFGKDLRRSR